MNSLSIRERARDGVVSSSLIRALSAWAQAAFLSIYSLFSRYELCLNVENHLSLPLTQLEFINHHRTVYGYSPRCEQAK